MKDWENSMNLTPEEKEERSRKVRKYRAGLWRCPPPPVSTIGWNDYSWIKYIDEYGVWLDDPQAS